MEGLPLMAGNVEIERRFRVIDSINPRDWPVPATRAVIRQDYLQATKDGVTERVRESIAAKTTYTHTIKRPRPEGQEGMLEEEREITWDQYRALLRFVHTGYLTIHKTRLTFTWAERVFELDVYTGAVGPLMILEVELPSLAAPLELPPFLPKLVEVTDDKRWSNASLAQHGIPKGNGCWTCDGKGWVGFSKCHICEGRP